MYGGLYGPVELIGAFELAAPDHGQNMTGFGVYTDQRPLHLGFLGPIRFFGIAYLGYVLEILDSEEGCSDIEDRIYLL